MPGKPEDTPQTSMTKSKMRAVLGPLTGEPYFATHKALAMSAEALHAVRLQITQPIPGISRYKWVLPYMDSNVW